MTSYPRKSRRLWKRGGVGHDARPEDYLLPDLDFMFRPRLARIDIKDYDKSTNLILALTFQIDLESSD